MSGVCHHDASVVSERAEHQRRVLSGQAARAEERARATDDLVDRQTEWNQAAKHRMDVRRQQRRGDAFAGNIGEQEVQRVTGRDEVDDVAADRACR